jgi:hypothetical protein
MIHMDRHLLHVAMNTTLMIDEDLRHQEAMLIHTEATLMLDHQARPGMEVVMEDMMMVTDVVIGKQFPTPDWLSHARGHVKALNRLISARTVRSRTRCSRYLGVQTEDVLEESGLLLIEKARWFRLIFRKQLAGKSRPVFGGPVSWETTNDRLSSG